MKKIVLALTVLLVMLVLVGCVAKDSSDANGAELKLQVSTNYTYIPLNIDGTVEENTRHIGNAIWQWEQQNPNRKIVSMVPIYRNNSYGSSYKDVVDGISIYSSLIK